ncbi:MAG TPA: D-alanyl-D-alanine carboxypeptidase [Clostridiaceae bacterium]
MKKYVMLFLIFFCLIICKEVKADSIVPPNINCKSAITVDIDTGEIIYALNIDEKAYPASITKLMTGLILAESKNKNDILYYTQAAKLEEPFSADYNIHPIKVGSSINCQTAMDLMLMNSTNDIAKMIGDNLSSSNEFPTMMNVKASLLNMKHTDFANPNGLPNINHYTTSYDLTLLGKAAFLNPWVKEVISSKSANVIFPDGFTKEITNTNKILNTSYCIAGKTGFTEAAGRCLLAIFQNNNKKIISVVLGAPYDTTTVYDDTLKIVNWSFSAKKTVLYKEKVPIKKEKVKFKLFKFFGPSITVDVPIISKENISYYGNYINNLELKKSTHLSMDPWKLSKNVSIGTVNIKERDTENSYKLYPSISTGDIQYSLKLLYFSTDIYLFIIYITFLLITLGIIKIIKCC